MLLHNHPYKGWGGGGLGSGETGMLDPIEGGEVRDKVDQFKGLGWLVGLLAICLVCCFISWLFFAASSPFIPFTYLITFNTHTHARDE